MRKFLHIGYPKNLSTTLQREFFSKHPAISYLGIGRGGDISYVDDVVNSFFEHDVKYCRNAEYHKKKDAIIDHFSRLEEKASQEGYQAFGASSEHLCASITSDNIETSEKASRLAEVFGSDTTIIVFIRNQADLVRSLYREGIRVGYSGTFDDYVRFLYLFQERNFVSDLNYLSVLETYERFFGKNNIHVFLYEEYVAGIQGLVMMGERQSVVMDLQKSLSLVDEPIELGHTNKAIPLQLLEDKRVLNIEHRHDLGNQLWDGFEKHRMGVYWNTFLDAGLDEAEIFCDVREKRYLLEQINSSFCDDMSKELLYQLSPKACVYWNRLMEMFVKSNESLKAKWLPDKKELSPEYLKM